MNLSKIKKLHVMVLGVLACVVVGVGFFFLLIKPVAAKKAQVQKDLEASKQVADQLPSAMRALDEAKKTVAKEQAKLGAYERSKMPNLSFASRDTGMVQLWHEQVEVLGPTLVRWAPKGGVRLISDVSVPAPPTNPNDIATDLIKVPIGKLDVVGDFQSIMNHIRAWNACPRLVSVDKPSISGMSPYLKATYDLTVYIFPRGSAGPQIQMAGTGQAQGGMMAAGAAPVGSPMMGRPSAEGMGPPMGRPTGESPTGRPTPGPPAGT